MGGFGQALEGNEEEWVGVFTSSKWEIGEAAPTTIVREGVGGGRRENGADDRFDTNGYY